MSEAPAAVTTRQHNDSSREVAIAVRMRPAVKNVNPANKVVRGRQDSVSTANRGAANAYAIAKTVVTSPAAPTLTSRSAAKPGRRPANTSPSARTANTLTASSGRARRRRILKTVPHCFILSEQPGTICCVARQARQRLLDSVRDLFAAEGIRAVSVEQPLDASGMGRVSFYRHFDSKDDLVVAVLTHYNQHWRTMLRQQVPARH